MLYKLCLFATASVCSSLNVGAAARVSGTRGAVSMSTLGDFTAMTIDGKETSLSAFVGKPTLVLNVASLWGTTIRDFTAMNALAAKYGDAVNILAFPCNQFGHQTNENNAEFLNTLKHVRPGNNFEVAPQVTVFSKVDVNGHLSHPLFKWMREQIMIPKDSDGCLADTHENGCPDVDALLLPRGGFGGTTVALWTPVTRSDIAWNFEKFLLDEQGHLVQRYHRYELIESIHEEIDALLPVAAAV